VATLKDRVEQALETAGIPRAGEQQRGWFTETKRSAVHLCWGYGKPVARAAEARSFLGQCSHVLSRAGFQLGESKGSSGAYLEIVG
jgi:hypothetical protein